MDPNLMLNGAIPKSKQIILLLKIINYILLNFRNRCFQLLNCTTPGLNLVLSEYISKNVEKLFRVSSV
jgi:hypothetical protein